ncbi:hypothetical protein A8L34_28245 [Bacillus sp. FJAT-27264]|uniref:hypothetical protein n=1 Tax=Paenibacillus sp. (strain DSM 101736 / FJAT-27264) TaxID=1850362 RepID=UPI000807E6D7|nr:hypothetical protein [Bacillus sp. FJAT-27264]OBZ15940.1 hypothetical protein A8L34_28245 [Bacillus sp. FJAT-27264]
MKTPKSKKEQTGQRQRRGGGSIRAEGSGLKGPGNNPSKGSLVKVNLWITDQQSLGLDRLKEEIGLKKSEMHRRALDQYLSSMKVIN